MLDHAVLFAEHDIRARTRKLCAGGDAERGADTVHIRPLVTEDKYVSRVVEELAKSFTEEAHFHATLQRFRLASAAVEDISAALADDGLIAAAPKGELHRLPCALIRARDAVRGADRDGERHEHTRSGVDVVRLFQQREARALQLRQMLRLKHDEEPPVVIAAIDAVDVLDQIRNQPLHLGEHAGSVELSVRRELFVIVDVDQRDIRHLFLKESLIMRGLRAVEPILKQHRPLVRFAMDGHAHHLIHAARMLQRHGDQRCVKIKMRQHAANVRLREDLLHGLVAPYNLSVPLNERTGNRNLIDQPRYNLRVFGKHIVHALLQGFLLPPFQIERDEENDQRQPERDTQREKAVCLKPAGEEDRTAKHAKQYAERQQNCR